MAFAAGEGKFTYLSHSSGCSFKDNLAPVMDCAERGKALVIFLSVQ